MAGIDAFTAGTRPGALSDNRPWMHATVYATTVIRPRDGEPYNVALVDTDEGRRMTNVQGIPPQDVRIGMRVRVKEDGTCEPA